MNLLRKIINNFGINLHLVELNKATGHFKSIMKYKESKLGHGDGNGGRAKETRSFKDTLRGNLKMNLKGKGKYWEDLKKDVFRVKMQRDSERNEKGIDGKENILIGMKIGMKWCIFDIWDNLWYWMCR